MSKPGCQGCYYWKPLFRRPGGPRCCHYLLIEDEKRGCPAGENCAKRLELDDEMTKNKDREYINNTVNRRFSDYE